MNSEAKTMDLNRMGRGILEWLKDEFNGTKVQLTVDSSTGTVQIVWQEPPEPEQCEAKKSTYGEVYREELKRRDGSIVPETYDPRMPEDE